MSKCAPRKTIGEIGATVVSTENGITSAKIISSNLPTQKEELENLFFENFKKLFNQKHYIGFDNKIYSSDQNTTSDLDFSVKTNIGVNYVELAELSPLSEKFGRCALKTGKYFILEFATWIFEKIILKKAKKYGALSGQIILVLYSTHWQFKPGYTVMRALISLCRTNNTPFAGIFIISSDGTQGVSLYMLHPNWDESIIDINNIRFNQVLCFAPGQAKYTINLPDLSIIPSNF